jgi:hypothetical protein
MIRLWLQQTVELNIPSFNVRLPPVLDFSPALPRGGRAQKTQVL